MRMNWFILVGLALVVLGLGLFLSDDFGQGWDDEVEAFYGKAVSSAYSGSQAYFQFGFQSHFGPGYQLLQYQLSRPLALLLPSWKAVHTRYLINFLFFQLGVVSLYLLARRFLTPAISLLAAALFLTQPLLFGHAFINHKDGVFLCLFTVAMASGLAMADAFSQEATPEESDKAPRPAVGGAWRSHADVLAPGLLLLLALLDGGAGLTTHLATSLVAAAYRGTSLPALNALFARVAENRGSISLSAYVDKVSRLSIGAHVFVAVLAAILLGLALLARVPRRTRVQYLRRSALMLIAAASLGLATATRVAGPLAGALVAVYFIFKGRHLRVVPALVAYVVASYAVTIVLWPALWSDPIGHLFDSLRVMSGFPAHDILFMGKVYLSSALPWYFLPVSIAVQLTEPMLLLMVVAAFGIVASVAGRKGESPPLSLLPMTLWLGIPLIAVALFRLPNYNSFRHYLFVTPPLFILAAVGASRLLERIRFRLAKLILVALILAPGIVSILHLHPYEYLYYNRIVDGVSGADGYYDLDYWCTSYREAMEYLNQYAPAGARVTVWGPVGSARTFSRADLTLLSEAETTGAPDYAMSCGPMARSPTFYEDYDTVLEVTVDGAVLARVKREPTMPG